MKQKAPTKYQYMLVTIHERDIELAEVYNTHNKAFDAMLVHLDRKLDEFSAQKIKKHFKENTLGELDGYDNYFGLYEDSAWFNGNSNYDWRIIHLTIQDNIIIKCE
ncbi:MAG: hypothetical protein LBI03_10615 [Clostridiales bacterium]|jgi:hypothetical protein|nr:hypothetical protein [Clostridiales bacterium]